MMTPAEKFVSLLETNTEDYLKTLRDNKGNIVKPIDDSKFPKIFNDTLKDFLETYLQVDIIWIGTTMTTPPTPDPFISDIGYNIKFSTMEILPLLPTDKPAAEAALDTKFTLNFKTGQVDIPTEKQFTLYVPLMLNSLGVIITNFASICNGIPPTSSEESRKVTKQVYKQVFDSLTMAMFNPLPSNGMHASTYQGTMSMANLYFKPITETSPTHPETIYSISTAHKIKFKASDSKAPSAMIDVFTHDYGYATESEAISAAQAAASGQYSYTECTTELRKTTMPESSEQIDRYYVTSISADVSSSSIYCVRSCTSEGFNVSENSNCKFQIVFQETDDTKYVNFYNISKVEYKPDSSSASTVSGDSDLIYNVSNITENGTITVYAESK